MHYVNNVNVRLLIALATFSSCCEMVQITNVAVNAILKVKVRVRKIYFCQWIMMSLFNILSRTIAGILHTCLVVRSEADLGCGQKGFFKASNPLHSCRVRLFTMRSVDASANIKQEGSRNNSYFYMLWPEQGSSTMEQFSTTSTYYMEFVVHPYKISLMRMLICCAVYN